MKSRAWSLPAWAAILFAGVALGQNSPPAFEVASVKPGRTPLELRMNRQRPAMKLGPDSIVYTDVTLRDCIRAAFQLREDQVEGPAWLGESRYTINAKAGAPASRAQLMRMLQALLVERFGLQFHREEKNISILALTQSKGGPKFGRSGGEGFEEVSVRALPGGLKLQFNRGLLRLGPQDLSMAALADFLSGHLRTRPVVDATGLGGSFEISLSWQPENRRETDGDEGVAGPDIYTALKDQLGLALISQRALTEVLVIDQANKIPAEN